MFGARIDQVLAKTPLTLRADGKAFVGTPEGLCATLTPPPLLPIRDGIRTAAEYRRSLPEDLGTQVVLLMRAGACAIGLWHLEELRLHKVWKTYVVRGHGKAQATFAKTKGKARGGAKLRLRNARNLLHDVTERLKTWAGPAGTFDHFAWSCPVRLWADFCQTAPPLPPKDRLVRIPWHVQEPGFGILERTRRRLVHGTWSLDPTQEPA